MKENFLPGLLGLGLIGSNFFSLSLLSRASNGIPDLARLATTENSASQLRYKKNGEDLDLTTTLSQRTRQSDEAGAEQAGYQVNNPYQIYIH